MKKTPGHRQFIQMTGSVTFTRLSPRRLEPFFEVEDQAANRVGRGVVQ